MLHLEKWILLIQQTLLSWSPILMPHSTNGLWSFGLCLQFIRSIPNSFVSKDWLYYRRQMKALSLGYWLLLAKEIHQVVAY